MDAGFAARVFTTINAVDKVKLGRALGKGARGAAHSLWEAAEAVAAEDPNAKAKAAAAANRVAEAHATLTDAKQHIRKAAVAGAKQGGRSALAPVKKFTSVVLLQVTGCFFALFALALGQATWKSRAGFSNGAGPDLTHKAWLYAALCALFLYFAVSSFLRARRRERR